jgi:hypothetical protein
MNRPLLIAAFALLVVAVPLSAQHGGGHAGGGHAGFGGGFSGHGSFGSGGFAGHAGSTHAFSGARSGGFAGHPVGPRYYGRNSAFGRFGHNHSGVGVRIRSYPYYGYNCWGGYCGYGGYYGYPYLGGGVDPYWWWDNGDNNSDAGANQAAPYGYDDGLANQMQQQGIPSRPAPDAGDQEYARSTPPAPLQQQEHTQSPPATVLVFRDQHQEQVQNYAIVGQTLWNFTPGKTQKIPLSDLDLPATQKANDAQGVEFRLPSSSEGQ